jgi:hypothetical protein
MTTSITYKGVKLYLVKQTEEEFNNNVCDGCYILKKNNFCDSNHVCNIGMVFKDIKSIRKIKLKKF